MEDITKDPIEPITPTSYDEWDDFGDIIYF